IVSIKNDGHYFCRAGGNRPDGLNEPVTFHPHKSAFRDPLPGRRKGNGIIRVNVKPFCSQLQVIHLRL
ncbi:hypothetical protein, partial [Escherichia coli]|uniref:hypothetical protein n=1 Tax=Escherichia coli TaxID=562 RepID=UPI002C41BC98